MVTANTVHECDSCGHEVSGYSKKDLVAEGWQWHDISQGRMFVMCGDCEHRFEQQRADKATV